MKKVVFAAFAVVSLGAFAQTQSVIDHAEVLSVREVTEQVNRPTERCWTETTERRGAQEKTPVGAIAGAIAGGILGHQVGGGVGKDIATGVGVIAGAMAGDHLANRDAGSTDEVRRCRQEDNWVRTVKGYEVTYRYGRQSYTAMYPYNPGRTIEVELSIIPIVR